MKKIFIFSLLVVSSFVSSSLASAQQVNINYQKFPEDKTLCTKYGMWSNDQCFNGGLVYPGYGFDKLGDYIINNSSVDQIIFEVDKNGVPGFAANFIPMQNSTWTISDNIFRYASPEEGGLTRYINKAWTLYYRHILANTTADKAPLLVTSSENVGIGLKELAPNTKIGEPVFRLEYVTNHYTYSNGKLSDTSTLHKEHAFFFPAWCGDGIVHTQFGEKYDDGVNNGKPGYASTDCKTKSEVPTPIPGICNGASNGIATFTAPTTNLCQAGTPSLVTEKNGKFTWTCNGINGGVNASCEAPKKVAPYCGDGIVQTGESCDLGVNNGKEVNGKISCDLSCNIPTNPQTPVTDPGKCDQTFSDVLYLGWEFSFGDRYTNQNNYPHTLQDFVVNFRESDDMNKDGKNSFADQFAWKDPYTKGAQVPANAKDVLVIQAKNKYQILQKPTIRKKDNISIDYIIQSTGRNNIVHKECINYEVAWCGDGIVDTKFGEKCDPNDPNKTNWGPGGCATSDNPGTVGACNPKPTPEPALDLSIKKYVDNENQDAQPGSAIAKKTNDVFNYVIKVKVESGKTSGKTTVKDVLPAGVELEGSATGEGWTCSYNATTRTLECTSNQVVESGKFFPNISIPVRVTATSGEVRNDATVYNPNEKEKPCHENNKEITGTEGSGKNPSCEKDPKNTDPAVIKPEGKNELSIKKYAGNKDGQVSSDALDVDYGKEFTYKYVVTASGATDQKNVTVTDMAPLGVKFTGFQTVPNGWSCKNGQVTIEGKVRHTAICTIPTMTKNSTVEFVVNSQLVNEVEFTAFNLPLDVFSKGLRNIAYVCSEEVKSTNPITGTTQTTVCEPGCVDPNDPSCLPPPPPPVCSDIPGHPHYDPACIKPKANLDLSIKKYVDNENQDAQPGSPVEKTNNSTFNYIIRVKVESGTTKDTTTTVKDVLPNGVELNGTPVGTNWNITITGKTITATSTQEVTTNNFFTDIIVPVRVTATSGEVRNDATVYNPNEKEKSCHEGNTMITGTEKFDSTAEGCKVDPKNTDPAVVKVPTPKNTDLEIKKYVKEISVAGDSQDKPMTVALGEKFNYYYVFENKDTISVNNVAIKDTFPAHLTFDGSVRVIDSANRDVTSDYTIKQGSIVVNGMTHITLIANKNTPLAPNSGKITFTVPVKISENAPNNTPLANMVYICGDEVTNKPLDSSGKNVCEKTTCEPSDPTCMPVVPPPVCTPENNPYNDPACITVENGLDLSIKKYIDTDDAQSAISKNTNSTFNYVIRVKVESGKTMNTTTVKDILPNGVELNGTATGNGWNIVFNGKTMTATSTQEVTANNFFSDIFVPVRVTASAGSTVRNDATVHNPNEKEKPCYDDNRMPNGNEQSCNKDPKNTDPAVFTVPGSTTPPPVTPPPYNPPVYTPYCGDGIVDKSRGEMCDLGTANGVLKGADGQHLCSADCTAQSGDVKTNPGEWNEEYYISIPTFAKVAIGKKTGTIPMNEYGMVIGKKTPIFALSDTVELKYKNVTDGIKLARTIGSGKEFSIKGDGTYVIGESPKKSIASLGLPSFHTPGNDTFYIIGEQDSIFVLPWAAINVIGFDRSRDCRFLGAFENPITKKSEEKYECKLSKNTGTLSLFNGSQLTDIVTTEKTTTASNKWEVRLSTESVDNIASFKVDITDSRVSSAGTSVTRALATFTGFKDNITLLKDRINPTSTVNSTNTNNSGFPFGTNTSLNNRVTPISTANVTKSRDITNPITSIDQFKSHEYNGNTNVYAFKGDLKIDKLTDLTGVKTVLVTGKLIINGNISYADANASWAFIAKGGIEVKNNVTNMAGVYLSVKDTANGIGEITGEATTTANILRIDGALYGDATKLFNSRTYARGTNSYDIVTAGTVIDYSTRALRNPPPLLSQYINAYKVQRVVR